MSIGTSDRGQIIARDGVRLHYLRTGGARPPLILLHGLTANARFFAGLLAAGLAEVFDVIRVDLRGRGLSDKPDSGYAIADHAADVLAVMDAAGVREAVVCGHSYGALLTLWLAAHHPDRVGRQILLDIATPSIADPEVIQLIMPSLDRLGCEVGSLDEYLARAAALRHLDAAWCDELAEYYRADVEIREDGSVLPRSPRAAIEQCIVRGVEVDWRAVAARAQPPGLVVCATGAYGSGARPIVRTDDARELVELLPDARYAEAPGNHVTMMFGANADSVVAAIRGFIMSPAPLGSRPPS